MKDIFHNIISIKLQQFFSIVLWMISLIFDKYSVWILEMKNENKVQKFYVRFLHHWNQDEQTNPLIQFLSSNSKIIYSSRAYCKISQLYGWTYWRKGILEYTPITTLVLLEGSFIFYRTMRCIVIWTVVCRNHVARPEETVVISINGGNEEKVPSIIKTKTSPTLKRAAQCLTLQNIWLVIEALAMLISAPLNLPGF